MAYCIQKEPTFTTKIDVVEPGTSETGEVETSSFVAKFKRLDDAQLKSMIDSGDADVEQIRKVLVGWYGLVDASGAEVPFSDATRDALLSIPAALHAITMAFFPSLRGAARKN
ncbi:hypothetical protein [Burkholderia gladioli]|uniref:Uncharacterized protein n=1 Tax=Burkholderia gladioli (strain BSR3) TaxID=999541 RepID=F2L9L1_BURGS|nr:hypothetical protein [Burkholderia gladioli]AEA59774.1 hypothetical protein bgla_1g10910 [Burkholderia gladioli BSR3]MBW5284445.1 hypothetical protein [Burkholderia gladioli]